MTDERASQPTPTDTQPTPSSPPTPAPARRPWATYALLGGAAVTALAAFATRHGDAAAGAVIAPGHAATANPTPITTSPQTGTRRPRVELVFALDTTGSMGGLIEGAKRKIWSLASFVARAQPTPELRVGLVGYRDLGDAYVTRVYDLDDDLDRVSARLRQFQADGGGDTPEHVARALHEAVHKMSWTDRQDVVRVVYLVGDAPPQIGYQDGFDYEKAARAAARKGIKLHTIRCGGDPTTESAWRKIASLGGGEYMSIQQDGGMHAVATPYDTELARLHDRLSDTAMGYGAAGASVTRAKEAAASAPVEVKAARAGFLARNEKATGGDGDLVSDVVGGKVALAAVPAAALPPELRSLDRASQRAQIEIAQKKRQNIARQIDELSRKRDKHLEEQTEADRAKGGVAGFDDAAKDALRKTVRKNVLSGLKL